ncbi:MAG: dockerin type I domain-containing protein [Candidatus Bathyarchaeia archaeon]
MKKAFLIAFLFSIWIILAFGAKTVSNANPETILYVSPFTTTTHVGEIFSVNVSVHDVYDLYAFQLGLRYNATILDALSVHVYPPFNTGPAVPPIIDDGNIVVSCIIGYPGPGVSGSFPIVRITFNATAPGNSVLDLYNTDLRDSTSNPIAHLIVDGKVYCVDSEDPEAILYVDPATTTIFADNPFSVNVSVYNASGLVFFGLYLGYNTTVLDALDVYLQPPYGYGQIYRLEINDTEGYIYILAELRKSSISFPLVGITFNATSSGYSLLHLYNTTLLDNMSNRIPHSTVDGEVLIFPRMTHTDFILEVTQVQCNVSREGGVTYFKLPTWSLFGPNTLVYDNVRQAVWMTSANVTYGFSGAIETFNGVMVMLNVTDGSALLYKFPLDVGGGFKGLGPSSCTLDNDDNVWIAIDTCFWIPEEPPESIPSLAKLCPENNTLTIFWLPKEFGWISDVKFHDGSVWCQSEKYLIKISGGDLADFWKISENPSSGCMYVDGDYVWITRYDADEVKRFNPLTSAFDVNFTDINSPLGICGDSSHTFVAEYGGNSILAINKENLAYSRVQVNKTPTYVCCTVKGNVWWSSPNSSIGVIGKIYNNTYSVKCGSSGPLTEGPNNTIWFSGRNYWYYLGPPYVTCHLCVCMRSDIRSPDVNGDSIVNARDVTYLVLLFRATPASPNWDQNADINGDDIIDARDITIAILNFGKRV